MCYSYLYETVLFFYSNYELIPNNFLGMYLKSVSNYVPVTTMTIGKYLEAIILVENKSPTLARYLYSFHKIKYNTL